MERIGYLKRIVKDAFESEGRELTYFIIGKYKGDGYDYIIIIPDYIRVWRKISYRLRRNGEKYGFVAHRIALSNGENPDKYIVLYDMEKEVM